MQQNSRETKGYVLIVTMWVTLGMSALAIYFANTVILQQHAAAAATAGHQSDLAQNGAIEYIRAVLTVNGGGTLPETDEDIFCENVPIGDATFSIIGRPWDKDDDAREDITYGLVDECAKLNLNTATKDMLLALPGMTAEITAAIIDWRDSDEDVSEGGAEAETYSRLERAYQTKNASFGSVEELRLVYGVTLGLLTGRDRNLNGIIDADEEDPRFDLLGLGENPAEDFGWLDYCTVWSREANQQSDGSARVNINGQNTSELQQLLQEALGTSDAERIMASVSSSSQSTYRSILQFYVASGMTAEQFASIDDDITTTDDEELTGLINVNTAPEAVLRCLPGMDEGLASQLTAYRIDNDESLDSVAWVVDVLGQETALQIGPYITTHSYQFSADIVTVGGNGRGLRRAFVVFDTVSDEVRILYRRSRAAAGTPFPDTKEESL